MWRCPFRPFGSGPEDVPAALPVALIPLLALAPVLIAAGWSDLTRLRISNRLCLLAVLVFLATLPVTGPADALWRLIPAVICFAIGVALFAGGIVGGGDVKFLPAVLLAVPQGTVSLFLLEFSAALLLSVFAVETIRRLPAPATAGFRFVQEARSLPMGLAIAAAGLMHPVVLHALATAL